MRGVQMIAFHKRHLRLSLPTCYLGSQSAHLLVLPAAPFRIFAVAKENENATFAHTIPYALHIRDVCFFCHILASTRGVEDLVRGEVGGFSLEWDQSFFFFCFLLFFFSFFLSLYQLEWEAQLACDILGLGNDKRKVTTNE
jgi:hypothetical protein